MRKNVIFETLGRFGRASVAFFVAHRSCSSSSSSSILLWPRRHSREGRARARGNGHQCLSSSHCGQSLPAPPCPRRRSRPNRGNEPAHRKDPKNPELYLSRANSNRTHQEWDAATQTRRGLRAEALEVTILPEPNVFGGQLASFGEDHAGSVLSRQSNHVERSSLGREP